MKGELPAPEGGASRISAPPCPPLANPKDGRGGIGRSSAGTPGGTHPARFRRTKQALRSRSKVKPQWGQRNTLSCKVKFWFISPHWKHSREVLYAGTVRTALPSFRNCHSSILLSSENAESWSLSLLFPVSLFRIKPLTFKSSNTSRLYSAARRAPSLKNTSLLKSFTYSCSSASRRLALNQFFESFLFLERLLCRARILSSECSRGLGFSRKRPSESVASLVMPTSTLTAFPASPVGSPGPSPTGSSTRNTTKIRPEGLSFTQTWDTRFKGNSLCITRVKKPILLRYRRAFFFFLFPPCPTSLILESLQPDCGYTKERYLCGFFSLGLFARPSKNLCLAW